MPTFTLYTLGASEISVSDGASLSGMTQGDGSQLLGKTITLNSSAWETVQVNDTDNNFEDSDNSQTLDGAQVYDGTSYGSGLRVEAEYTLTVQDPDGNTYTVIGFNINEPGVTSYATVEGLAFVGPIGGFPPVGVPLAVISRQEGPAGSSTPYSTYATPACFTPGCLIDTPSGPRLIQDLAVGDAVLTRDHGSQTIEWVGRTTLGWHDLLTQPRLRPIVIERGTFGLDQPNQRISLSPQHRILRTSPSIDLLFGTEEVLVAAKHLTDLPGVHRDDETTSVTYIHLTFATHQIIKSDGLWSESLLPSDLALSGISDAAKQELTELFGPLDAPKGQVAARRCLKAHEARVFLVE